MKAGEALPLQNEHLFPSLGQGTARRAAAWAASDDDRVVHFRRAALEKRGVGQERNRPKKKDAYAVLLLF